MELTSPNKHIKTIGLAKMFVWVFPKMLQKNPNKHFGQPNTSTYGTVLMEN